MTNNVRIQIKRDASGDWTTNNPVLAEGELGYETDTGKIKVGDGTNNWADLDYVNEELYLQLAGGTMSGAIDMGSNAITSVADPTSAQDVATKNYVDTNDDNTTYVASDFDHNDLSNIDGDTFHVTTATRSALQDANAQLSALKTTGTPTFVGATMSGDLDMDGNDIDNIDSGSTVSLQEFLMIGETNAKEVIFHVIGGDLNDEWRFGGMRLSGAGGTNFRFGCQLPLPCHKGGLSLHVKNIKIKISEATSNRKVSKMELYSLMDGVDQTDNTAYDSNDLHTTTFTEFTAPSDNMVIGIRVTVESDTNNTPQIWYISGECWYE